VCSPNWEEANLSNYGRGVGMINCVRSLELVQRATRADTTFPTSQYDIAYGETRIVSFTFTTPEKDYCEDPGISSLFYYCNNTTRSVSEPSFGTTVLTVRMSYIKSDGFIGYTARTVLIVGP